MTNATKERKFVYILQYYIGDNEWEGTERFADAEEVENAGLDYLKKFFEIFKWLYNEEEMATLTEDFATDWEAENIIRIKTLYI